MKNPKVAMKSKGRDASPGIKVKAYPCSPTSFWKPKWHKWSDCMWSCTCTYFVFNLLCFFLLSVSKIIWEHEPHLLKLLLLSKAPSIPGTHYAPNNCVWDEWQLDGHYHQLPSHQQQQPVLVWHSIMSIQSQLIICFHVHCLIDYYAYFKENCTKTIV